MGSPFRHWLPARAPKPHRVDVGWPKPLDQGLGEGVLRQVADREAHEVGGFGICPAVRVRNDGVECLVLDKEIPSRRAAIPFTWGEWEVRHLAGHCLLMPH